MIKHIEKARDMIYGDVTLTVAKDIFESVKEEIKEVQRMEESGMLGYRGRFEKQDEARKKGALQLAQMLQANQNMVNAELDAAEKEAYELLAQASPPPPDHVLREFNERYAELKANLQVNANAYAANKLIEFMRDINDPYLAKTLSDDYAEIGGALMKHTRDPIGVNTLYGRLRSAKDTAEQAQAREVLKEAASLRQVRPFNPLVELGTESTLGPIGKTVLQDPAGFIQANEGGV